MSFFLFGMKNYVIYSLLNNIQLKYTFDFLIKKKLTRIKTVESNLFLKHEYLIKTNDKF